ETTEPHGGSSTAWVIALAAAAGGMGWGIRGSYGHETGAMIAGVLIGYVLIREFLPSATSLKGARVVALLALGVSFGGSMTYGRTLGLTQAPNAVGDWDALRWGLTGVAIKGGVWFGFAGLFLGMGMGRTRYRTLEGLGMVVGMLGLIALGLWALNEPYDPKLGLYPRWFFSGDWPPPKGPDPTARREVWGGLLFALVGLAAHARFGRGDRLAGRMAIAGFVAGALGFTVGQSVQAFHAWNRATFQAGGLIPIDPNLNWWNLMEITFGAVGGAGLAAGLAWNRALIAQDEPADEVRIAPGWEIGLAACHAALIAGAEFSGIPLLGLLLAFGPAAAVIALPAILGGRFWPYLFALPIVALPIAGKTLKRLSYENPDVPIPIGWLAFVAIPLTLLTIAALAFAQAGRRGGTARRYGTLALPLTAWLYVALCFSIYQFPWPWSDWNGRTTSTMIYAACLATLTFAATRPGRVKATGAE
ncbi:MAG: hypothetical protein AB7I30_13445, partial [Isosphaeraceae bacterium]